MSSREIRSNPRHGTGPLLSERLSGSMSMQSAIGTRALALAT